MGQMGYLVKWGTIDFERTVGMSSPKSLLTLGHVAKYLFRNTYFNLT